jgi:predicted permease
MAIRRNLESWLSWFPWYRRQARDADLERELRDHLELEADEHTAAGLSPEQAAFAAHRALGNTMKIEEDVRAAWGFQRLETLVQDLHYGLRILRKSPGFTAVAVLTLALGIGANTAIFTLINAVMLKMLPVSKPQELISLNWAAHADRPMQMVNWIDGSSNQEAGVIIGDAFSYRTFVEVDSRNHSFSEFFAFKDLGNMNVTVNGDAGLAAGQLVSGDYFSGLGVPAVVGRTISNNDDLPEATPVVVISYGYWKSKFGGDREAIGKTITVNGVPFTLIGVTPPEFFGLSMGRQVEISMPLRTEPLVEPGWVPPNVSLFTATDHWWLNLMGRLKPGVTEQLARAELEVIFKQSATEGVELKPGVENNTPWLVTMPGSRGLNGLREQFSKPLFILMTLVGLVLFIACANVANLLLARAAARQREMALRLALGAGRTRLLRQLLTESIMLAGAGGVLGLLFAYWTSSLLAAFLSLGNNPIVLDTHPDLHVLAFTSVVSLATGLLFGLAPALRGTRTDLTPSLKTDVWRWRAHASRLGLAKTLVIAQVGMSLVLLIGAGLFVRTLLSLEHINVGFNQRNLLLFGVNPTQDGYKGARLADFYEQVQDGVDVLPGVRSATMSSYLLLSGNSRRSGISVPGYTPKSGEKLNVFVLPVGQNFFETMQIPLLLGRGIGPHDDENAPKVAVINETMARHFFNNENPIGRQFVLGGPTSTNRVEIVGVTKDAKYYKLRGETPATVYQPFRQTLDSIGQMHFEVRTAGDPRALIPAVRQVIQRLDRNLPLYDTKTQSEQVDELLLQERLFARLSVFFGLLALLLACVGLYGLLSYAVLRRTSEIGVRMALGAKRRNILCMVLGETARLVSSQISGLLYGLKATDPGTILLATLLLSAIAAFAGFLPARRASRVDPMVALRYE